MSQPLCDEKFTRTHWADFAKSPACTLAPGHAGPHRDETFSDLTWANASKEADVVATFEEALVESQRTGAPITLCLKSAEAVLRALRAGETWRDLAIRAEGLLAATAKPIDGDLATYGNDCPICGKPVAQCGGRHRP